MKQAEKIAELTIPCHWDKSIIEIIIKNNNRLSVGEVYGSLAAGGHVGHGRSSTSVVYTSKKDAVDYRKYLKKRGIRFTYLLNAPFGFNNTKKQINELNKYLDWVLSDLKPDALTVTSLELMACLRKINLNIPLHISTIAGVRSVDDLKKYLIIRPDRVIPHHDLGKNKTGLLKMVEFGRKNGIEMELLATESCLRSCPKRDEHYSFLAKKTKDKNFHTNCNERKLVNPREFLLAGGIVRPEDVSMYEKIGVKYFKITGRSKPKEWLPEVVNAYQKRSYSGNLVRLLGIDPALKAEEWIFIDNKSLDGFIENYPQDKDFSEEIRYCDDWMISLYKKGKFFLTDGSEYEVKGNSLVLKRAGVKASMIIEAK